MEDNNFFRGVLNALLLEALVVVLLMGLFL
jgi:hypothetical protein